MWIPHKLTHGKLQRFSSLLVMGFNLARKLSRDTAAVAASKQQIHLKSYQNDNNRRHCEPTIRRKRIKLYSIFWLVYDGAAKAFRSCAYHTRKAIYDVLAQADRRAKNSIRQFAVLHTLLLEALQEEFYRQFTTCCGQIHRQIVSIQHYLRRHRSSAFHFRRYISHNKIN